MQIYPVILLYVILTSNYAKSEELPECQIWSKIEDYIKVKSDSLSCLKNRNCTGMNCFGSIAGEDFHAGLQINHCENPNSVAVFIDIPQLDIHNWKKSFTHGSTFDLTDDVKGEISLLKEKDNIIIGLSLNVLSDAHKYFPKLVSAPLKIPIFNDTAFPIPSCETTVFVTTHSSITEQVTPTVNISQRRQLDSEGHSHLNGNCSINNSSCQKEEVCLQLDKSYPDGICVCRVSYSRDETGQCVYKPESSSTAESNATPAAESQASYQHRISTPVLQILISVMAVLVLIGIIYVAVRFKAYQYLRRKFRVQVYEHVLLGQQEDNDESLTDPVA